MNYTRPTPRPLFVSVDDLGRFASATERRTGVVDGRTLALAVAGVPVYSDNTTWGGGSEGATTSVTSRRAERLAAAASALVDCQRCGSPFAAARSTARFCSDRCRNQAFRA